MDIKILPIVFFVSQCGISSFRSGILKCFINFAYRKSLWMREGGNQAFSSFFLSQCRKYPSVESFGVSFIYGIEKNCIRGVGEYRVFP